MINISFIGMAACGKSTIGKAVANKIGVSFVDTDLLIEQKHAATLEEIKNKYDYKFVRDEEEKVILGLTSSNSCLLYTSPSPRDLVISRMPSSA